MAKTSHPIATRSDYQMVEVSDPKDVPAEELRTVLSELLKTLNMRVLRCEGFYSETAYIVEEIARD